MSVDVVQDLTWTIWTSRHATPASWWECRTASEHWLACSARLSPKWWPNTKYVIALIMFHTGAFIPPTSPFPLPSPFPPFPSFPLSRPSPSPSLASPSFPSSREAAPWNQLGDLGSAVSSPFAPADIDFGVFWEGKTHLTAIVIWIFVYWNLLNF